MVGAPGLVALGDAAEEAFHGEVEVLVVVLDRVEVAQVADAHLQFLGELAPASVAGGLAALHLAAGELPEACHLTVAALDGEHAVGAVARLDYAGRHVYRPHGPLLSPAPCR